MLSQSLHVVSWETFLLYSRGATSAAGAACLAAVVIFAEHLFDGEAYMLHPLPPNNIIVQLSPAKDVQTHVSIRAMTGVTLSSTQYDVFELNYVMPKSTHLAVHGIGLHSLELVGPSAAGSGCASRRPAVRCHSRRGLATRG